MRKYSPEQIKKAREYVTDRPALLEWIDEIYRTGSVQKAAVKLQRNKANGHRALDRAMELASSRGWAPDFGSHHPVPIGQQLRGVSTLYDDQGNVKLSWVKTKDDQTERLRMIMDELDVLLDDKYKGKSRKLKCKTRRADHNRETWYVIGDHHMGMYAWAEECGADWDTDKASGLLRAAVDRLVESSPATESGVLLNVGDFFHMDNHSNATEKSGNILDVDTRWSRVVRMGLMTLKYCVEAMLEKHRTVTVYSIPGNHDRHTAIMLALAIGAFFDNDKRVKVHTDPAPFIYHRFGKCLIGMTHGDTVKKVDHYAAVMADERPKDWGDTVYRYWYLGHLHTSQRYELRGCLVERFRTLAARDAWHAGAGYGSGRDMTSIVLHKEWGEVERHTTPVQQLEVKQ